MITFYFKNIDQLINDQNGFLTTTKEFNDWETMVFKLRTSNGMELNYNTRINDPRGIRQFVQFKDLKDQIKPFYNSAKYFQINLEIKLKFPNELKETIDPKRSYNAFYLNFYSDATYTYMTASFLESNKNLDDKPVKNWMFYNTNLYNQWKTKNKLI